ncbi:MAG: hypothetical protein ACLPZJ_18735 [Terriglobales bacterium]
MTTWAAGNALSAVHASDVAGIIECGIDVGVALLTLLQFSAEGGASKSKPVKQVVDKAEESLRPTR